MAIDSSLFMVDLPAGTYTAGDKVTLNIKAGPSVVRSGRGAALLKRLTVGLISGSSGSTTFWKINVKNSDWVDYMTSITAPLSNPTSLDERTGCIQRGNDCPLTPNSSWSVEATCVYGGTTTVANAIYALIDIDYPSVSSIVDPDKLPGIPTTIDYTTGTAITLNAPGSSATAAWNDLNVDFFKAGYAYALQKVEIVGVTALGFIALANAAGMAGLQRIMPISAGAEAIRNKIEYATKLVKGPLDIRFLLFVPTGSASTGTPNVLMDFVKRRVD